MSDKSLRPTFLSNPQPLSESDLEASNLLEPRTSPIWVHLVLVFITFLTTALSGLFWLNLWSPWQDLNLYTLFMGFPYAVAVMAILGCHEFGHYFAALYHRIRVTLPYFIPFPPIHPAIFNFGTFGAVIRINQLIRNRIQLMDIGAYGPLAGFLVALLVLIMAASTVPPIEYLYTIHPNYRFLDAIPGPEAMGGRGDVLVFGENIIFFVLLKYFMPYQIPMSEMYHYPLLLAAYIGLFVTALNLLPFGQLDGGHIVYALFGEKWHRIVSWVTMFICIGFGIIGLVSKITNFAAPSPFWPGWLVWGLIMAFVIKPYHPPMVEEVKLDGKRKVLAIASLVIFILCFAPVPFDML